MPVVWERSGEAFYDDLDAADGTRYHLIVERLPGGEWDWSVWRQSDGSCGVHTGDAGAAQEAMGAAERAAA